MNDPNPTPEALRGTLSELRRQLASLESLRALLGDPLTDQKKAEVEARIRALVSTGGGTLIAGDVDVSQGDFVSRDKWQLWVENLYLGRPLDQVPPDALLQGYLRSLAHDCRRLPLGVVDPRFLEPGAAPPVPLSQVYVDLDVQAPPRQAGREDERAFLGRLIRAEGGERTPLLEAIADPRITRFVLLGDPGSGKTTFVNYMAHALATGAPPAPPFQNLLPVRLLLREVAARCIPPDSNGQAGMLWSGLRSDLAARLGEDAAAALFPHLQRRLLDQGGLLLLDGLDEVPEADRRRGCLREALADLAAALPPERCRVLVTARPYAYADRRWRLADFSTLVLAPFSQEQVQRFVSRWYQAVRPVMGWDEDTAADRGDQLLEALQERPYLADLAVRPLLLTLMATLHTSWGQLPQDRADLYEETVKLLFSRWQRAREVKQADGEPLTEPLVAKALAVDEARVRAALHRLAFAVQERQGAGAERSDEPADIAEGEVSAAFAPFLPEDVNPQVLLRYLETRAGLLVARAPGSYAFPHRSFQEYLAACYLADRSEPAHELRRQVWADPGWWREVFLFGVGRARRGGLGAAVHVVNTLLPEGPAETPRPDATAWRAAVLGGQALLDLRFPAAGKDEPDFQAVLKRVRRWLVRLLETPAALSPRERAAAGDVLSRLGDPRPGVATLLAGDSPSPARRERPALSGAEGGKGGEGLPDILWIEIPAGPFTMGSAEGEEDTWDDERPQHTLDLPTFWISRYPITNAHYRPFVEGGGYDEPRYWSPDGWAWRTGARQPDFSPLNEWRNEDLKKQYMTPLKKGSALAPHASVVQ